MIPASSLFCCRDHVRERCDKWAFSPGVALPRHNPRQLFLAMNSSVGFEFFSNLQAALAWLQQVAPVDTLARIYRRELRRGEGCPPRPGAHDTTRINLKSQLGVFVLTGACVVLAIIASLFETAEARRHKKKKKQTHGHTARAMTDGEMLRQLLREVEAIKGRLDGTEGMAAAGAGAPAAEQLELEQHAVPATQLEDALAM